MHKEAFNSKHGALQKLVKKATGGVLPPLDRTLVDWGLSVNITPKLNEANFRVSHGRGSGNVQTSSCPFDLVTIHLLQTTCYYEC